MARKKAEKPEERLGEAGGQAQKPEQDKPANPPENTRPGQGPENKPDDAETGHALAAQQNPPARPVLVPVASGGAPTEGAVMVAIKTRSADRFYRCRLEFGRDFRIVERGGMNDYDWQRLLAEPNLVVEGVVLVPPEPADGSAAE